MCDRCGWRELVAQVKAVVSERHAELGERQQTWIEAIAVTADDDRHVTDHAKSVVRRILRERRISQWRLIPKACDRSKWSEKKKQSHRWRKKLNAAVRRYGTF